MDKILETIKCVCKFSWNVFAGILGILFIIIMIIVWLGFFGIIPPGEQQTTDYGYPSAGYDPFN